MKTVAKINLRQFATFEEVATQHADAFTDNPQVGEQFTNISGKLKELGYDVIINNREKAEFIPSSRLGEVVTQRDTFKTQAENLGKELEKLKNTQGISPEAQTQIQTLMNANTELLGQLEEQTINMECMAAAIDAHNPKDVVAFIDKSKINVDKQGNVHGVTEEIKRIRAEKPYMFKEQQQQQQSSSKAGQDNTQQQNNSNGSVSMNSMIRRAAGITSF